MVNNIIPYGKHFINQEDIDAVINALKSDYLTQGPTILEFERQFSRYIGCKYSVAIANGTAALHLCTLALGLKEDDKVITTPITFAASANCVKYCGGEVIFSDIDPLTYLIDIESVKNKLSTSPIGTYKGLILVDFAGQAVNLEEFKKLAVEYNLWIIEDACHAPGGYFVDSKQVVQKCGNGNFADLAIFSFHPVKHIATGEGGMITTNNEKLYNKLLELRSHGITRDPSNYINSIDFASGQKGEIDYPGWYMEMQNLGFNYRITDFQAALGISQLSRAESGILRRKQIAEKYNSAFVGRPYILGQSGLHAGHAYHLYVLEVKNRIGLYNYLKQKNIFSQIHYIPCHLMPYYRGLGWKEGDMPNAELYYKNCISIPMFPSLTNAEIDLVISEINKFYE